MLTSTGSPPRPICSPEESLQTRVNSPLWPSRPRSTPASYSRTDTCEWHRLCNRSSNWSFLLYTSPERSLLFHRKNTFRVITFELRIMRLKMCNIWGFFCKGVNRSDEIKSELDCLLFTLVLYKSSFLFSVSVGDFIWMDNLHTRGKHQCILLLWTYLWHAGTELDKCPFYNHALETPVHKRLGFHGSQECCLLFIPVSCPRPFGVCTCMCMYVYVCVWDGTKADVRSHFQTKGLVT